MTTPFINLTTPQSILTAVPMLLRFLPTNSVVAIMLTSPEHSAAASMPAVTLRFDITATPDAAAAMPRVANLSADRYHEAILIAICDPDHDTHALRLLDAAPDALRGVGIPVTTRLTTHTLSAPDHWTNPDTGEQGRTVAYLDSAHAAAAVYAGQVVAASRADIEAEFAVTEPAPWLAIDGDFDDLIADTVTELFATMRGRQICSPDLATRAAIIVSEDTVLRDALLRLGAGREDAAARVWTGLAAQLRGAARAQVLTVAAFNYYLANDPIRVGIALDEAEDAALGTGLTTLPRLARLIAWPERRACVRCVAASRLGDHGAGQQRGVFVVVAAGAGPAGAAGTFGTGGGTDAS